MNKENDSLEIDDSDVVENDFTEEELADDKTDWKAKALEAKGIAKRRATKLSKIKEDKETKATKAKEDKKSKKAEAPKEKTDELGYGEKAFLKASDIQKGKETELVQAIMKETGKDLEGTLESNYFKAELADLRKAEAVADAMPDGSKRQGTSPRNTVEYWIAKKELPPNEPQYTQLRRDVVNARQKQETSDSNFTQNPVIGG